MAPSFSWPSSGVLTSGLAWSASGYIGGEFDNLSAGETQLTGNQADGGSDEQQLMHSNDDQESVEGQIAVANPAAEAAEAEQTEVVQVQNLEGGVGENDPGQAGGSTDDLSSSALEDGEESGIRMIAAAETEEEDDATSHVSKRQRVE